MNYMFIIYRLLNAIINNFFALKYPNIIKHYNTMSDGLISGFNLD
jgi:hypothetical protein